MTQRVILFHYTVSDSSGQVIDSSRGEPPMAFLEGAGQLIPALERALLALQIGDKQVVQLQAGEAYGHRDPRKVVMVPREVFPEPDVKVGELFQPTAEEIPYRVTEVSEKIITLDGNHPLAGIDLVCHVEVIDSREATDEELEHGHAHSADKPHHH